MPTNVVFFAWNRSIPGREALSAAHFEDFIAYLTGLKDAGKIASFAPVFLDAHGGDLNGFFFVQGDAGQIDALVASDDWIRHMTRAQMHLEGSGAVRGVSGDAVMARMQLWTSLIPS